MKELSIFVDESGDFGKTDPRSPYYLIGMVFHDQKHSIREPLSVIQKRLLDLGFPGDFYIHSGPAIRGEREYRSMSIGTRRKLVFWLFAFLRHARVTYRVFMVDKRQAKTSREMIRRLSAQIAEIIRENPDYFYGYDKVKIYYDGGQTEVNTILRDTFGSLIGAAVSKKAFPKNYRLSQAADLACALSLVEIKMQNKAMSSSEKFFFKNNKELRKNFLIPLMKKRFNGGA